MLPAFSHGPLLKVFMEMLGHPPAIDAATVIVAWPGADLQSYHRDTEAGTESAVLLFVPLDETSASANANKGPPP
eukprot:SAG31_NODE_26447_length_442_cov_0.752187_2_plen_74_part_01